MFNISNFVFVSATGIVLAYSQDLFCWRFSSLDILYDKSVCPTFYGLSYFSPKQKTFFSKLSIHLHLYSKNGEQSRLWYDLILAPPLSLHLSTVELLFCRFIWDFVSIFPAEFLPFRPELTTNTYWTIALLRWLNVRRVTQVCIHFHFFIF